MYGHASHKYGDALQFFLSDALFPASFCIHHSIFARESDYRTQMISYGREGSTNEVYLSLYLQREEFQKFDTISIAAEKVQWHLIVNSGGIYWSTAGPDE